MGARVSSASVAVHVQSQGSKERKNAKKERKRRKSESLKENIDCKEEKQKRRIWYYMYCQQGQR